MRALIMFLAAAVVLFPLTTHAMDVSGDQWGTWTRENSPYNVIGEIPEPEDDAGEVVLARQDTASGGDSFGSSFYLLRKVLAAAS
jgi:hypothetical protein